MANKIKVIINGKEKEINASSTIQDILDENNITSSMLVIEKNMEITPKDKYSYTHLQEGDNIEIVSFVGGG